MPKRNFTEDEMAKYSHQYSAEIKLIQQYFGADLKEIILHLYCSFKQAPGGKPMLYRVALAAKAMGTPADRKETDNQFISSLTRQLFGKPMRQSDIRRYLNKYLFRFAAELPIKSGSRSLKLKPAKRPIGSGQHSLQSAERPIKPGKQGKHITKPGSATVGVQAESLMTLSPRSLKTRDKEKIISLARGILARNRPMFNEAAFMGATFIVDRLEKEIAGEVSIFL